MLNSQNIKQAIGIQVMFMLKIKLKKYIFRQIIPFFDTSDVTFLNLVRMGTCILRMPQLNN